MFSDRRNFGTKLQDTIQGVAQHINAQSICAEDLSNIAEISANIRNPQIRLIKKHEYNFQAPPIGMSDISELEDIIENNGHFVDGNKSFFYYVLEWDRKIVGHLLFAHHKDEDDDYINIKSIEINNNLQGQQLGSLLMGQVLAYAKQNNVTEIDLLAAYHDSKKVRNGMFAFYFKLGFRPKEEFVENHLNSDDPNIWYGLDLQTQLAKVTSLQDQYEENVELEIDLTYSPGANLLKRHVADAINQHGLRNTLIAILSAHAELFSKHSDYDFHIADLLINPQYQHFLLASIRSHPYHEQIERAFMRLIPRSDANHLDDAKQSVLKFILGMQSVAEPHTNRIQP